VSSILADSSVVWSVAAAVVVLIFLSYFIRFRRRVTRDFRRKLEASELGIDRPVAQYPFVDPAICIGCGGCVEVCPQGDVLGMVRGTATVINGLRCIGIAYCENACPVGAIEVGLGDIKGRRDMPLLDAVYQSSVPGVYVVGELGGLALVRNAIQQGRTTVEHIANSAERAEADAEVLDVAIVGAGPAGLSAGFTAAALGLSYVIVEREQDLGGTVLKYPRRKMVLTEPMDIAPWGGLTKGEYEKEQLLEIFAGMVREAKLGVEFGQTVDGVHRDDGHFQLVASSKTYRARSVVLALGRRGTPRKLGVPGEALGKVMYRLSDAESYRGNKILIVGGGDSAVEAAVGLARQPGNDITLSYRKPKLVRVKAKNQKAIDELIAKGRVDARFNSQVVEIGADTVRLEVEGVEEVIDNEWVFVLIGGVPPFGFLKDVGVRFGGPAESAVA
jgi:thioredoxin reductase/NAD-dependent dihydropyrimidine dehydrogenase PreA subunit